MAVRMLKRPSGPKWTPTAVAEWIAWNQKIANQEHRRLSIRVHSDDGKLNGWLVATPEIKR